MRRKFLRDFEAGGYLDIFLVMAVSAVLLIRLFLQLSGYPQLGGDVLHVAHMLWGGLLMVAAIIILLSFLGRSSRKVAAIIGGIGFGVFIDEVGKFITQDNDYFFQPTASIIYVIFILTYFTVRWLHSDSKRTQTEYIGNALKEVEEIAVGDLDNNERERALAYLGQADQNDPFVQKLAVIFNSSTATATGHSDVFEKAKRSTGWIYRWLAGRPWFARSMITFFIGQLVVQIAHVALLVTTGKTWLTVFIRHPAESLRNANTALTYFDAAMVAFSVLAAIFVALGVWRMNSSRLAAFRMFQRSILVLFFFVQPLMFYRDQWSALVGLVFDVFVFLALRFMIERETVAQDLTGRNSTKSHHKTVLY